eukprot:4447985-Pyramimonas_sp.AAC.1
MITPSGPPPDPPSPCQERNQLGSPLPLSRSETTRHSGGAVKDRDAAQRGNDSKQLMTTTI